jgi:hypothetical protein
MSDRLPGRRTGPIRLREISGILIPKSRLVLLEDSHFFLFRPDAPDFKIVRDELSGFLVAADNGVAPRFYGERNETSRKDMGALWDGGLVNRGYKPRILIVMDGMALGFFIPRTGGPPSPRGSILPREEGRL